jgi:hypothetical protein
MQAEEVSIKQQAVEELQWAGTRLNHLIRDVATADFTGDNARAKANALKDLQYLENNLKKARELLSQL